MGGALLLAGLGFGVLSFSLLVPAAKREGVRATQSDPAAAVPA